MNRLPTTLISLLCLLCLSSAAAHATIVLGVLSTDPITPSANESFTINLQMNDPSQIPIEDAVVLADFSKDNLDASINVNFEETDTPGLYKATSSLPQEGKYKLIMRDQTFRQEEARANLSFVVLGSDTELVNEASIPFVFPPTATGSQGLRTWLIWLIALPVVAGIVVTAFVLLSTSNPKPDA